MREINLSRLNHSFATKPLLIGGMAMEYYDLRLTGDDIDFVVTQHDYAELARLYPQGKHDLYGDLGVTVGQFELWTSICLFDYGFLSTSAIEKQDYLVVSLEKLLFLKALAIHEPKYEADTRLIVNKILDIQYGKDQLPDS